MPQLATVTPTVKEGAPLQGIPPHSHQHRTTVTHYITTRRISFVVVVSVVFVLTTGIVVWCIF